MSSSDNLIDEEVEEARRVLSELLVGKYEVSELIGRGSYGKVFCVKKLDGTEAYAAKMLAFGSNDDQLSFSEEAEVLEMFHGHPNVVDYIAWFKNASAHCIVMERMSGDFANFSYGPTISASQMKSFLHQIISAVAHCHDFSVIHRDLKPSNILIDADKNVLKLGDFGSARIVGSGGIQTVHIITPYVGTRAYTAPEILIGDRSYTIAVDMWSVGCIFARMIKGETLFDVEAWDVEDIGVHFFGSNEEENHAYDRKLDAKQLKSIFSTLGTPSDDVLPGTSAFAQSYVIPFYPPKGLEAVFPNLESSCLELLKMMFVLDPKGRITAREALHHPYFNT